MSDSNPLFPLEHRHAPLPLDTVKPEHFLPALDRALAAARQNVAAITSNPEAPTFENTVLALEAADEGLDRIASVFFHLLSTDGDDVMQKLGKEIPPKLTAYHNDVVLDPVLYQRFESLYTQRQSLPLSPEQLVVLENHVLSFRRNGASLSDADKQTLRDLDEQLSTCAPAFSEHVLKATQAYALWCSDPRVIEALPRSAQATAKAAAEAENRPEEWKFTLDAPSYMAFMTYAPDAALRQEMWRAFGSRCVEGQYSNLEGIRTILDLRYRRARLLGYTDHIHYTLERRMAGNQETLDAFYAGMQPVVMEAARRDLEAVRAYKENATGEKTLHPWDYAFYAEQLKKDTFDLDQEALRPWFEFDATLQACFDLGNRLFHLQVERVHDLPVNHESVRTFRITDQRDQSEIGYLIVDPFPRSTKRPGAWMMPMLSQGLWGGQVRRPVVAVVCNFTPPVGEDPSLLTLDEATTLFHEFGHALHELLSQCTCRSVSGTSVFWDFVELPSQLLENWLMEPEFLKQYARHHETGEALPDVFIERIHASRTFQKGYQAARQLAFGTLDLAWYSTPPDQIGEDLLAFERNALKPYQLFESQSGIAMSPAFQHIFSGGYGSGYYSYKWAEVLEADVFASFQEEGIFNPETAQRLQDEILSKGGSQPPMDLFKAFRGREPDPNALLSRDGLIE